MDWTHLIISISTSLLVVGVTYGVLKTKVEQLESKVEHNSAKIHANGNEEQKYRLNMEKELATNRVDMTDAISNIIREMQEQYVTWRQFESFVAQFRSEQSEIKADVKKLIELVSKRAQ